ncbi:MAG: WecB/TagA/CpsF family glycosyltransferase [Nitrospiraceae bacterium]|nr:WecB/TagA/CpsF family glycosyltransferase [Nitrospiraceae bacterium]
MASGEGMNVASSVTDGRQTVDVLGSPIDAIQWSPVLRRIVRWAQGRESRYACICNVHVVVNASRDQQLASAVRGADLATPDGMPVALCLRLAGFRGQPRIAGPDLMWACLEAAQRERVAVYLYGGRPETLEKLEARVRAAFPLLCLVGSRSPPFRPLTPEEDAAEVERIERSGAQLVFVGLGCPKQEIWMAQHRGRIHAVMMGVGAAFDFHAGVTRRAPLWMQRVGLEWLHCLFSEPKRLWRRYLITNTVFSWYFIRLCLRALSRKSRSGGV